MTKSFIEEVINKLLCIFNKHKPYDTTRMVLTGNYKAIEIPTVRCLHCNCFIYPFLDRIAGAEIAHSIYIEPDIKTVN